MDKKKKLRERREEIFPPLLFLKEVFWEIKEYSYKEEKEVKNQMKEYFIQLGSPYPPANRWGYKCHDCGADITMGDYSRIGTKDEDEEDEGCWYICSGCLPANAITEEEIDEL